MPKRNLIIRVGESDLKEYLKELGKSYKKDEFEDLTDFIQSKFDGCAIYEQINDLISLFEEQR